MLRSRERMIACEQTGDHVYEVKTRTSDGEDRSDAAADAPPEQFVERIPHEGGDVFFAPVVETLRNILRPKTARREAEGEQADAMLPALTEKA